MTWVDMLFLAWVVVMVAVDLAQIAVGLVILRRAHRARVGRRK